MHLNEHISFHGDSTVELFYCLEHCFGCSSLYTRPAIGEGGGGASGNPLTSQRNPKTQIQVEGGVQLNSCSINYRFFCTNHHKPVVLNYGTASQTQLSHCRHRRPASHARRHRRSHVVVLVSRLMSSALGEVMSRDVSCVWIGQVSRHSHARCGRKV